MLVETEKELGHRLEEACAVQNVSAESTGELMRLEETLLDAAKVAKQAVSLRRRLRSLDDAQPAESEKPQALQRTTVQHPAGIHERFIAGDEDHDVDRDTQAPDPALSRDIAVREFRDGRGVEWRVWQVIPKIPSSKGLPGERLGEYGEGWLAFESHVGTERRRLPHFPDGWRDLDDGELEKLLDRADVVQVRRKGSNADLHSSP